MTREQLKKHWEVINEYKNGAEIQVKFSTGGWMDALEPVFDEINSYRVKTRTVYAPFSFDDAEKIIGKVIKSKDSTDVHLITSVTYNGVQAGGIMSYGYLLKHYTFSDNSVCGIQV